MNDLLQLTDILLKANDKDLRLMSNNNDAEYKRLKTLQSELKKLCK